MQPDPELLTSRFSAGARNAALTALRQRSQNTRQKKVNAQPLDPIQNSTTSQDAEEIQTERILSSAHFGDIDEADRAAACETSVDDRVCRILEEARTLLQTKRDCATAQIPAAAPEPCLLVTTLGAAGDHADDAPANHVSVQHTRPVPTVTPHCDGYRDRPDTSASARERAERRNSRSSKNGVKATKKQSKQPPRSVGLPEDPSPLEEIRRSLNQLKKQKKIVDENLEFLQRTSAGASLDLHLEALAGNTDAAKKLWRVNAVDTMINKMTKEIQAELASDDVVRQQPAKARTDLQQKNVCSRFTKTTSGAQARKPREAGAKTSADGGSRRRRAAHTPGTGSAGLVEEEAYHTHLYGRPAHVGVRRTLKKDPYLRFSSPVHPSHKKQRPQLVESVRGVKVKSCKTQTSLLSCSSEEPQHAQYNCDSSNKHVQTQAEDSSGVVAILLGPPIIGSSRRQHATAPPRVFADQHQETRPPSSEVEQPVTGEALPPPSITVEVDESREDECDFPGTEFIHVSDIQEEEESVESEKVLLVDGARSPEPVEYQGPVFPPQTVPAPQLPPLQVAPRDPLVDRLVEWVEQQVMSTMILQMMQQAPSDPTLKVASDQSELEESITSDIVEAAGGGGLQLFVDSNVDVDSALIRQLVNEVLAEIISQFMGQRDTPDPGPVTDHQDLGQTSQERVVPLLPTPVATPPASPLPLHRRDTPIHTPTPSEPASLVEVEPPQEAADVATTPTPSPEPTPATPTLVPQAPPALTWEDAELPLDEERPEENLDTRTQPLVMSVAQEEPSVSSPPPRRRSPSPPVTPPPASPPRAASPTVRSERSRSSSSSSSDSSSTVTPTEAAMKPISEGELLISVHHLAMTDEDVVGSTSSSLPEIDFDPPSEGQVKGHTLQLTEMEQGVAHSPRGERPQPEGSWGGDEDPSEVVSVGEVKDDWTVKRQGSTNPVKLGSDSAAAQSVSSPGQVSQCPGEPISSFEVTNQSSAALGDLTVDPNDTLASEQQGTVSLSSPAQSVIMVKQLNSPAAEQNEERKEEMEEVEESVSAAGDSDCSSVDIF